MAKKDQPTQLARKVDCIKAMNGLGYRPKLIIADPPYNFCQPYEAYEDNKPADKYLDWTSQWMAAAVKCLDKHGSLFVFAPDEWVSEIDILARKELQIFRRQWIIWAFTFGQRAQRGFTRSHCHILWFTKTKSKYTFNFDAVRVPSARQLVYNDKRAVAGGKPPDDTWMLLKGQMDPYMGPDKDTWLVSRVCGTYKERKKHSPNQIPVPIMERIVLACSNPGDHVVDPFAGTGSSGVACAIHGRHWEGFDISATCVNESNRRMKKALAA